jgi:hypothetical protein
LWQGAYSASFLLSQAAGEKMRNTPGLIEHTKCSVACADQLAGGVHYLLEDRCGVKSGRNLYADLAKEPKLLK